MYTFILQAGIASALLGGSYAAINSFVQAYGALALFILMLLEGSSFPVPSEIVVPLAGYIVAKGMLPIYTVFPAVLLGSIGGLAIDYYIGYFLGKEVVYRHLSIFHISKEKLDRFDSWFARNGTFAVFASRLIPVVRTIMSFPAGFARMPAKRFFTYSIAGTLIWDAVLFAFGLLLISSTSAMVVEASMGAFGIALLMIYYAFMRKAGRQPRKPEKHASV
jgi:membrane protein DedA with SNARE-associated domain